MKSKFLCALMCGFVSVSVFAAAPQAVPAGDEKIAEFSASHLMDSSKFKNTYRGPAITLVDGKLQLNNGDTGKSGYSFFSLHDKELLAFDSPVLVKVKFRITKYVPGTIGSLYIGTSVGKENVRNSGIFVAPGKIVLGGYGTFNTKAVALNKDHEIAIKFDPRNGENTVWVDGNFVNSKEKIVNTKNGANFSIGDGSSTIAGEVIIEKVEIFKVK